jgi:hypothetical protein
MAMEWRTEKGTEIPESLVEKLGNSLFEMEEVKEEPMHPADQLASALLGASANATLKLPGGGEIRLDRKGLRRLARTKVESDSE